MNYIKRFWITVLSLSLLSPALKAADEDLRAYLIVFGSKTTEGIDPSLSNDALDRREKFGIELDATDYPVEQNYIDAICNEPKINLRYSLRWLNAVVVETEVQDLSYLLTKYIYVKHVAFLGLTKASKKEALNSFAFPVQAEDMIQEKDAEWKYGESKTQISQIEVDQLHKNGLTGKGVRIAVFDAGFYNAHLIPAFAHLRKDKRIWSGYDVVDMDNTLTDQDNHGTAVSSCIAGYEKGKYIGSAPDASLYLFRTENSASEYHLEELNWMKAAELADSMGLDMVSSSLGYTTFDLEDQSYSHSDLDGRTSYISIAAQLLIKKGIAVVNSAGNSGDSKWIKIGTPADVDALLTVGAVDQNQKIASFSSRGYNAIGVIKPDICALGVKTAVASTFGTYYRGNGTSYATPVVSGAVACLLQAFPDLQPSTVFHAVRVTATRNSFPDSLYGYGIANFHAAWQYLAYAKDGFDVDPSLSKRESDYLLFNNNYDNISYTLYAEKKFLGFIPTKKKLFSDEIQTSNRFTYISLADEDSDCSINYTLKLKLKSSVDKHSLKYRHLSICSN